jgi:hypothetical protein
MGLEEENKKFLDMIIRYSKGEKSALKGRNS